MFDGDTVVLATTLVLFKLNQNKIKKLEFDQLMPFLQSNICDISITDDAFFLQIQKGFYLNELLSRIHVYWEFKIFEKL